MIKALLYFCVALSAVAFFFLGANVGYIVGHEDGINDFILNGLKHGTVYCHYLPETGGTNERKSCPTR